MQNDYMEIDFMEALWKKSILAQRLAKGLQKVR